MPNEAVEMTLWVANAIAEYQSTVHDPNKKEKKPSGADSQKAAAVLMYQTYKNDPQKFFNGPFKEAQKVVDKEIEDDFDSEGADGNKFVDITSRANKAFRSRVKGKRKCPYCDARLRTNAQLLAGSETPVLQPGVPSGDQERSGDG